MKIVFFMKGPGSARNFESMLELLADRGHELQLAFDSLGDSASRTIVERLAADFSGVSLAKAPSDGGDRWAALTRVLRLSIDYLRYLDPRYADAPALRERVRDRVPAPLVWLSSFPLVRGPRAIDFLRRLLGRLERAMPVPERVTELLRAQSPDVVLVTPLVGLGSVQADYVRGAKSLGIPVGLCVHSWDNLTNKGLLRDSPDLVAVWNHAQLEEAVELHGVPPERVAVTGAHSYDHWFGWSPQRTRRAFCAETGLSPERPFFLYVCSSEFIAPDEVSFVRKWVTALRALGHQGLAEAGVLVRPHPQNASQWSDEAFDDDQVAIWPRRGANPMTERDKMDYFESIFYSAGVVGINTSALIESAIVGRRVHTVLAEDFEATQLGTLHFHLLAQPENGLLRIAKSLEAHVLQLAEALSAGPGSMDQNRRFLSAFVRPHGLDDPATPRVVQAIEEAAREPVEPAGSGSVGARALRVMLIPLARVAEGQRQRRRQRKKAAAHARVQQREAGQESRGKPSPTARRMEADPVAKARAVIRRIEEHRGPILAGPFFSEVGYELLYWIPFLTWAFGSRPELAERVTVLSRGGTSHWYRHLGVGYADLYDDLDPEELRSLQARSENVNRGSRKQMTTSEPERDLLEEVAMRLELADPAFLHPGSMFDAYWELLKSGGLFRPKSTFAYHPMEKPPLGPLKGKLPERFVAARFYFNAAFPETEENLAFVASTLERLGERTHVVLLNPPIKFDDHWDYELPASDRIVRLDGLMTPRTNLEIQTIAISRAQAFVGTYGGLSYLPPLLRVPALAFYSDASRFRQHHLEIATRVSRQPGYGPFLALDTAHLGLASLALGGSTDLLESVPTALQRTVLA